MSVQTQINSLIEATNLESLRNALVQTLTNLNETIVSGGVQSVEGELVDNTDPANPVVNLPYLLYEAIVTQSGTNAPEAVELINQIGEVTYQYNGVGSYSIISSALFTSDKTTVVFGSLRFVGANLIYDVASESAINFSTSSFDLVTGFAAEDGQLPNSGVKVEIHVYP